MAKGKRNKFSAVSRFDYAHKKNTKRRCRKWGVPRIGDYRASEIFDRDGWCCHWCGKPINPALLGTGGTRPDSPTIDHLVALSRGGWDCASNVVASHYACNSARSSDLPLLIEGRCDNG